MKVKKDSEFIYTLFCEYADALSKQTEAEKAEELNILADFAEKEGAPEQSPYCMFYAGFRAGVNMIAKSVE